MADARFAQRQRQLEDTALKVLAEQGISGMTLEAVADRLGYTKQSIYHYFKNKEDMLLSCFTSILDETRADIAAICSSERPPDEKLEGIIRYFVALDSGKVALFALHRDGAGIIGSLRDGGEREHLAAMMREIPKPLVGPVREGIKLGMFTKEKPETLARIVFGMISGILMVPGAERDADLIVGIIMKGIRT